MNHVIMVASENDALIGGKVGGVGDVIKGLPRALAALGWSVTVIVPGYGYLHKTNPSRRISTVRFPFRGKTYRAEVWHVEGQEYNDSIMHLVLENPGVRGDPIYFNDPPETPFKQDATKYALFCSAVGQFLKGIPTPYTLHLHDWHAATLLFLRELHPAFSHLKGVRTAFTIHNLAIQGTRPMQGDDSSVETWFPELFRKKEWISGWKDHRYEVPCYNPMAVGIRYADKVNTVSPNYAEEILRPSDHANGFYGGEGLEQFLQGANNDQRLFGIINGIEYPDQNTPKMSFRELCGLIRTKLMQWNEKTQNDLFNEVIYRINMLKNNTPKVVLTSVSRIVEQKIGLLLARGSDGLTALEQILNKLEERNGLYILFGNGTSDCERRLAEVFKLHERLLFVNGYSQPVAQALYANGTLFLMPSVFEPCGLSQMFAMRDCQPCIVHAVGGLKDTVIDNVNGFSFSGGTLQEKADGLVQSVERALKVYFDDSQSWSRIKDEAARSRFTWEAGAKKYVELMYS